MKIKCEDSHAYIDIIQFDESSKRFKKGKSGCKGNHLESQNEYSKKK